MTATYLVASLAIMASNFVYQFFCDHPDWTAATERSWFQGMALAAVGVALALRSINQ